MVFSDLMRRFKNCGACHIFPSGGRGVFVEPGGRATFHPQGLWEKWSAFFAKMVSRNGPFRLTIFGVCRAGGDPAEEVVSWWSWRRYSFSSVSKFFPWFRFFFSFFLFRGCRRQPLNGMRGRRKKMNKRKEKNSNRNTRNEEKRTREK